MSINPKFYHYNKYLQENARQLRKNSTLAEIILWCEVLKGRKLGYQFHRQRTINKYIGDFFCKPLSLVIELDGATHEQEEVKQKDIIKEKDLDYLDYFTLRFKDEEVYFELEKVREDIVKWIGEYELKHPEVLKYKKRNKSGK